jgi:lysine 2,3-aminomutase
LTPNRPPPIPIVRDDRERVSDLAAPGSNEPSMLSTRSGHRLLQRSSREQTVKSAKHALRTSADLTNAGLVSPERVAELENVAARYAVAITPEFVDLIDPRDASDPIARQFVPNVAELDRREEERADPIGDLAHSPIEGIVHRCPDRVLLKLVNICAVYCRFCFRRETVGQKTSSFLSRDAMAAALAYIRKRPEIWEVILTGGDPLVLSARRIREVMKALEAIDHVKILRIHTRVPVAAPDWVTRTLVRALRVEGKAVYVVLHANHPRELTATARAACARFIDAGIPMLSQSVLLSGVNDDADTLGALMRVLVETRIKPYYLHHADLATGTAHLRTGIPAGQALMRALRARHSGLCQPTYVLDIPGGHGKVPIGPSHLIDLNDTGTCQVEDSDGRRHAYPSCGRPDMPGA